MKKKYFFDLAQICFIPRSLKTTVRGKVVPPTILTQSQKFFAKSSYFDITNKVILQISKSKPKKISILFTFN